MAGAAVTPRFDWGGRDGNGAVGRLAGGIRGPRRLRRAGAPGGAGRGAAGGASATDQHPACGDPGVHPQGVAETTANDLLEAARVSRRTFYKYFAGKLEVLESIYHSAVQLLLARFGGLRSEAGSDEDWLRAMVSLFFDYHLAVGPIIRMMQEEALHAGSPLAAHRQRAHLKIVELWTERLGAQGAAHDALTYRVLIWAMEAASLELLNASDPLELPRVKRVLGDLLVGTLCPRTQAPTRLQG